MRRIETLLRNMMLLMLLLVAHHVSAAQLSGIEITSGFWRGEPAEYLAGRFVVGLAEGKSAASLYKFLSDSKCLVVEPADRFGVLVGEVRESSQLFEFIEKLDKSGLVRFAEPVIVNRLFLTPNDPDFSRLWGLNNTGQNGGVADADIDAPEGWNYGVGDTSIIVGVLDTGIPIVNGGLSHPDLDDSTRYLLGPNYETWKPADRRQRPWHARGRNDRSRDQQWHRRRRGELAMPTTDHESLQRRRLRIFAVGQVSHYLRCGSWLQGP